jgi:hypothetical protein
MGPTNAWGMSEKNWGENAVAQFNQEMLFAACRTIYEMAGEN